MILHPPRSKALRLARRLLYRWPLGGAVHALQDAASRRLGRSLSAPPLPPTISVETCTACNNDCAFCPQSSAPRPRALMEESVFARLVERLREASFGGTLLLSLNNEPLIDDRLERFAAEVRGAGLAGRIGLLTNGLLLTEDRARSLFSSGVDSITVNAYSEDGRTLPPALREWVFAPRKGSDFDSGGKRFEIHYRLKNEVLDNRAGSAPNKPGAMLRRASCVWPFRMLSVTTDGSALLCCNDFYCATRFGTVGDLSLAELWGQPFLEDARAKLAVAERSELPLCAVCDFKGYLNPSPVWYARVLGV